MEPIISFKGVKKTFGGVRVLDGMDLDIFPGETITIIGGSGSGKSVTLKLLLGLIAPDAGKIFFKGNDVTQMPEEELIEVRKEVGMLFQGAALFDSISVGDNVAYPIREHFDYPKDKVSEIVEDRLRMVGLPGKESMRPADLSGGMKKRVGLARAIATNPAVILYDEPTTGLDPTNTMRINNLILDLQKKLHVTSIVVTHDMESAFKVSDRLAMLYNRRIEYVGTVDEVRSSANEVVRNFISGQIGEDEASTASNEDYNGGGSK